MLNIIHPESGVQSIGFTGIYKATARMTSGVSCFTIPCGNALVIIPLTTGFWETVYLYGAHISFQEIIIIPPAINILTTSDVWRAFMDLTALKKRVKLIANVDNIKVDVPTVWDFCATIPHILDEDTVIAGDVTINIHKTPLWENVRYFDITVGTKTYRLAPCMTHELQILCATDLPMRKIDVLCCPWRFPVFGGEHGFNAIKLVDDYPTLKGYVMPFDYSCHEEFLEMQDIARRYKHFLEPIKNYMLTAAH